MSYTIATKMHSETRFLSSDGKAVFIINKDGCHVPEGVSTDEAAQIVIERLNDHIKRFTETLEKENAELKAKIADGIRVGVVSRGYKFHPSSLVITSVDPKLANATLILDYPFFKQAKGE